MLEPLGNPEELRQSVLEILDSLGIRIDPAAPDDTPLTKFDPLFSDADRFGIAEQIELEFGIDIAHRWAAWETLADILATVKELTQRTPDEME